MASFRAPRNGSRSACAPKSGARLWPKARWLSTNRSAAVPRIETDCSHSLAQKKDGRIMDYDLIIKHGTIVDGTGAPRYEADLGVSGGKIAAIGQISGPAREVIDAKG